MAVGQPRTRVLRFKATVMQIVITRRAPLDVPDGINIFIFSLASELLAAGNDVLVVGTTLSDPDGLAELYEMKRYPEVTALSSERELNWRYARVAAIWYKRGRKLIESLRPGLVIVNGALPFRIGPKSAIVAHDLERRIVGTVARTAYKRFAYGYGQKLVATCSELRWALGAQLAIDPRAIAVIPTCIDPSAYVGQPLGEREDAILHVGTDAYKNPTATVRAFARIGNGSTQLYLTGKADVSVGRIIASMPTGVQKRIHLLGYIPAQELRRLLGSVRLVSVPSRYFVPVASPTVIEAFACGTPVVAFDGISRDLVRDRQNSLLCAGGSEELASCFRALLADDRLWEGLSRGAVRSTGEFSASRVASAYLDLAQTLV